MGSDFENSEDREGDSEERGMGSNPKDIEEKEQELASNSRDEALRRDSQEREVEPDICTGEKAEISTEDAPFTFTSSSSGIITRVEGTL
jgi:hypothetical protein